MTSAKQRVLVTVKTYPTLSTKYGETVCTAGIRNDGSWVRIYPVPFRRLNEKEQYSKYDWIECELDRVTKDKRSESYRPRDVHQLVPVAHVDTRDSWRERRKLVLQTARVYTNLDQLVAEAKQAPDHRSLAVFKPTKVIELVIEEDEREFNSERLRQIRQQSTQQELFAEDEWRATFTAVPKLPYKFSYRFEDDTGRESTQVILDWEIGQLFWNCTRRAGGNEMVAIEKVRKKYVDEFFRTDLHLFLGTLEQWHFRAPQPWVIVGVFPIPHETQRLLDV